MNYRHRLHIPNPFFSGKPSRGFSLVEVVLALGVVSAAVLALIGILGATFTSAREITLQNRALNMVTHIEGALRTATGIRGLNMAAADNAGPFERVYVTLAGRGALDGTNFLDFFAYQKGGQSQNGAPEPAVAAIFLPQGGQFTLNEALTGEEHRGIDTASVFRVRVKLSELLKNKMFRLNRQTFEADQSQRWAPGVALPANPDEYALAYLPLSVEVYPHDFTDATNPGTGVQSVQNPVKPILTVPVVLNR